MPPAISRWHSPQISQIIYPCPIIIFLNSTIIASAKLSAPIPLFTCLDTSLTSLYILLTFFYFVASLLSFRISSLIYPDFFDL